MKTKPLGDSGNLCSSRSSARGLHQRVVSFSFWGEMKTGYWEGIVANLGEGGQTVRSVEWLFRLDGTPLSRLGGQTPRQ